MSTEHNAGYGTLQIIPSLRGFEGDMNRQLAGIMPRVGTQAGADTGRGVKAGLTSSLGDMASVAVKAFAFAGPAAAAGEVLTKGWGRLTTIQDSTSALGIELGNTTKAAQLLDQVLATVQGTPFKFDQFAAAAQQMVGMGIQAQKVPGYLSAIGEASATQGSRANEFAGRLSETFGQIAAQGQVQLQDVWQISATGVNALAILANSFGVTREGMRKMISDGAVPAGKALDALAKGILHGSNGPAGATVALSGTMAALRKNMSGAVAGIEPAAARLGAALLKPFTPVIVGGATSLASAFDGVASHSDEFAQGLINGAHRLEEMFAPSVRLGQELAHELVPVLGDLAHIGGEVAGASWAITAQGLHLVLEVALPLARVTKDLTGFLSDQPEVVFAVAGAWVAYSVATAAASALSTTHAASLTAEAIAARGAGDSSIFVTLTSAALTVAAFAETIAVDGLAAAFTELAATEVSAGVAAAGITAGIVGGASIAITSLARSTEHGKAAADAYVKSLHVAPTDLKSISHAMSEIDTKMQTLWGDSSRSKWREFGENISPWNKNTTRETIAELNRLHDAHDALAQQGRDLVHNYTAVGKVFDFNNHQVYELAQHFGVDLSGSFAKSQPNRKALIDDIKGLRDNAEQAGIKLEDAVTLSPEEVAAAAKQVKSLASATESAFSSFTDVLQLKDEPVDPKSVASAHKAIADAEAKLDDARAKSSGSQLRDAQERLDDALREQGVHHKTRTEDEAAARAVRDAREHLGDVQATGAGSVQDAADNLAEAKQALSELMATDSPLNKDKIQKFYADTLRSTMVFSANIQTALRDGYDPAFVSRLLAAGPEKAGPILAQLVDNATGAFVTSVNNAETQLSKLTAFATETARLTASAVNDASATGQQKVRELQSAIVISQELMRTNGKASIADLASVAGISAAEVKKIATDFNLTLDASQVKIDKLHAKALETLMIAIANSQQYGIGGPSGGHPQPAQAHGRWGRIDHMAVGGTRQAMVGSGRNMVWWDEPETGGEAYIPRIGDLGRSEAITRIVARWFGGEYVSAKELAQRVSYGQRFEAPSDRTGGRRTPRSRRQSGNRPIVVHNHGATTASTADALMWAAGG